MATQLEDFTKVLASLDFVPFVSLPFSGQGQLAQLSDFLGDLALLGERTLVKLSSKTLAFELFETGKKEEEKKEGQNERNKERQIA